MAKQIGDWNKCRCGEGYQETAETLARGFCNPCLEDQEQKACSWDKSCTDYGCPFCGSFDCQGLCVLR